MAMQLVPNCAWSFSRLLIEPFFGCTRNCNAFAPYVTHSTHSIVIFSCSETAYTAASIMNIIINLLRQC